MYVYTEVYYMYVGIVVYIYIYVPGTFMSCMNYVCSTMYLPLCTTVMYDRSNRECVHACTVFSYFLIEYIFNSRFFLKKKKRTF
jgi:hypothetical protein